MPSVPLAVAAFLVAGLVAWQYSDGLVGLLACWVSLSVFLFVCFLLVLSVGVFDGSLVSGN